MKVDDLSGLRLLQMVNLSIAPSRFRATEIPFQNLVF